MSKARKGSLLISLVLIAHPITAQVLVTASCSKDTWMINELGQTPCQVTAIMQSVCHNGAFDLAPIPASGLYSGPAPGSSDGCVCSTVTYSLMSACAACQGGTWPAWADWMANCNRQDIQLNSYSQHIPSTTSVPGWAFIDIINVDHGVWNRNTARSTHSDGIPDIPGSTEPVGSSPPTSTPPDTTKNAPPVTPTPPPSGPSSPTSNPPGTATSGQSASRSSGASSSGIAATTVSGTGSTRPSTSTTTSVTGGGTGSRNDDGSPIDNNGSANANGTLSQGSGHIDGSTGTGDSAGNSGAGVNSSDPSSASNKMPIGVIVGVVVAILGVIIASLAAFFIIRKKRSKKQAASAQYIQKNMEGGRSTQALIVPTSLFASDTKTPRPLPIPPQPQPPPPPQPQLRSTLSDADISRMVTGIMTASDAGRTFTSRPTQSSIGSLPSQSLNDTDIARIVEGVIAGFGERQGPMPPRYQLERLTEWLYSSESDSIAPPSYREDGSQDSRD